MKKRKSEAATIKGEKGLKKMENLIYIVNQNEYRFKQYLGAAARNSDIHKSMRKMRAASNSPEDKGFAFPTADRFVSLPGIPNT